MRASTDGTEQRDTSIGDAIPHASSQSPAEGPWVEGFLNDDEKPDVDTMPVIDIESPSELARRMAGGHQNDITHNRNTEPNGVGVRCPKCGCTQIHVGKKGYDAGSGVVGVILFGPLGLAAGAADKDQIWITCLGCGHKWKAGQAKKPQSSGCLLFFVMALVALAFSSALI